MDGEGGAAKFAIYCVVVGCVMHASNALKEATVQGFNGLAGGGSAWGMCPNFAGVGKDWGDEAVEEFANNARGVEMEFGASAIKGVECTPASG